MYVTCTKRYKETMRPTKNKSPNLQIQRSRHINHVIRMQKKKQVRNLKDGQSSSKLPSCLHYAFMFDQISSQKHGSNVSLKLNTSL